MSAILTNEQLQELWLRMTPRLQKLLAAQAGLLGQRIGVAADFPPHPDLLVTDLHKRALEACEAASEAEYGPADGGFKIPPPPFGRERKAWSAVASVGAESLAAKEAAKPKPLRWRVCPDENMHGCLIEELRGTQWCAALSLKTREQATAVTKTLNELEAAK